DNGGGGTPIPPPASLGSITLKAGATTTMASRKGSWYDLPVLDVNTSYTVTNATPTNASFQFTGTDGQWHDCVITGGKFTTPAAVAAHRLLLTGNGTSAVSIIKTV
ncbi:MAG: hypothetical protein RR450_04760, partial [Oscillospiraceae bacterium]